MFLWDETSISKALENELLHCPEKLEITNVVFDSRRVVDNSLFIAKKGAKNDGHNFIKDVLEMNKSTYVLASKIPNNVEDKERIILVKNVNVAYPVNVNNIFSKKITPIITNKYELRSIILFAIGVVLSPGMADSAMDVAAQPAVISATVIFLSSKVRIVFLWNSFDFAIGDTTNIEVIATIVNIAI